MGFWRSIAKAILIRSKPVEAVATVEPVRDDQMLEALLTRTGFIEVADYVRQLALPCLDICYAGPGENAQIGASRLGGLPDLPDDVAWPTASTGEYLSFYGQINLADPEVSALETGLRSLGLFSLFVGNFDGALEPAPIAAIHSHDFGALRRRAMPGPREAFHDNRTAQLNPVVVSYERRLSFVPLEGVHCDVLEARCPEGNLYALWEGLGAVPTVLGQWLGYAPSHEDLRESVYFHQIGRRGQERLRIWSTGEGWESDDENVRWQVENRPQIDAGVASWRSLLTIESNKEMGLWINDADPAFSFIPADDLARGDTSRMVVIATQS